MFEMNDWLRKWMVRLWRIPITATIMLGWFICMGEEAAVTVETVEDSTILF
jgi:hypothetical protein